MPTSDECAWLVELAVRVMKKRLEGQTYKTQRWLKDEGFANVKLVQAQAAAENMPLGWLTPDLLKPSWRAVRLHVGFFHDAYYCFSAQAASKVKACEKSAKRRKKMLQKGLPKDLPLEKNQQQQQPTRTEVGGILLQLAAEGRPIGPLEFAIEEDELADALIPDDPHGNRLDMAMAITKLRIRAYRGLVDEA